MNLVAARLFQPASLALAGALFALIILAVAVAMAIGGAAYAVGAIDISPFRWA